MQLSLFLRAGAQHLIRLFRISLPFKFGLASGRFRFCLTGCFLLLCACGGGGGGGGAGDTTSTPQLPQASQTGPNIAGYIAPGPVTNASCTLQLPTSQKLQAMSAQGYVSFGKSAALGLASAQCVQGSYVDQASGKTQELSLPLRAAVQLDNSEQLVVLSPFSETALRQSADNWSLYRQSLQELLLILGLREHSTWPSTVPKSDGTDAARELQAALSALSYLQLQSGHSLSQVLDQFLQPISVARGLQGAQRQAWFAALEAAQAKGVDTQALQARLQKPRIMGRVSGLPTGQSLVLQLRPGQTVTLDHNGPQTFFSLDPGSNYQFALSHIPDQVQCAFTQSFALMGQIGHEDVGGLDITCSNQTVTLGGTVSGLPANTSVTLRSNLGESVTLTTNGPYQFSLAYAPNSDYSVRVTGPNLARCSVDWAEGKVLQAAIKRVAVHCVPRDASGQPSLGVIRAVDIAQSYSQPIGSPYQLLVPGRKALLRAFIHRTTEKLPQLELKVSGQITPLYCPSLPLDNTTPQGAPVHQYDNQTVCTATLEPQQVKQGLSIALTADLDQRSFTPLVNTSTSRLQLKLIPLTIGQKTAVMRPRIEVLVQQTLLKHFPLSAIDVQVGSPARMNHAASTGIKTSQDWEAILDELETYRVGHDPNTYYYGFMPQSAVPGLQGMAYVDDGQQAGQFRTGIGLDPDNLSSWLRVLVHELGHNLSLHHAQCEYAQAASVDPFWLQALSPIAWPDLTRGKLSAAALMDLPAFESDSTATLISPTTGLAGRNYDVMSYCAGDWLSEFNYHKVASYIQAYSRQITAARLDPAPAGVMLSRISGSIQATGAVEIRSTLTSSQWPALPNQGNTRISLQLSDGRTLTQYTTPARLDHALDVSHFVLYADLGGSTVLSARVEQ